MKRPRLRMLLGSIACLTARIIPTSVGVLPQTSKCNLASVGQCATSADEPGGNIPRREEAQLAYCIAEGGSTESGMKAITRLPVAAPPGTGGTKLDARAPPPMAWIAGPTFSMATRHYITMALPLRL